MTAELHWFPIYSADWLGSRAVSRMLPEQEGAFLRLLLVAWGEGEQEPSLPSDNASLANMSRLGGRWRKLGPLVREQFVERGGKLYNARLSEIWREQQQKHADAVKRAKKAVDAREAKRAAKRSTGDPRRDRRDDRPDDPKDDLGHNRRDHLGDNPGLSNLESEGEAENAQQRSLPPPAPDGLPAAPDGAGMPGAEERPATAAPARGWATSRISRSAILAQRAVTDADRREQQGLVDAWCETHPEAAESIRAELAAAFKGAESDHVVAAARDLAFVGAVQRALERDESTAAPPAAPADLPASPPTQDVPHGHAA